MLDGKRFFPETGMPIWKMARRSVLLAVWLPEPFTVATWMLKSFTFGKSFPFQSFCSRRAGARSILFSDAHASRSRPSLLLDPPRAGVKNGAMVRHTLPEPYLTLDDAALAGRIVEAKRALGSRLVILGHHYQRDDVIEHADVTGDSYKLARLGAERTEAEYVVFAGVHFMAESADILRAPHRRSSFPICRGLLDADMRPTTTSGAGAALERLASPSARP